MRIGNKIKIPNGEEDIEANCVFWWSGYLLSSFFFITVVYLAIYTLLLLAYNSFACLVGYFAGHGEKMRGKYHICIAF